MARTTRVAQDITLSLHPPKNPDSPPQTMPPTTDTTEPMAPISRAHGSPARTPRSMGLPELSVPIVP